MCLLFVAIDTHADYPLIIAGNRDEFYDRPTAGARFWDDAPQVLAGRDLLGGGTWLGISRDGRWAAVTNYREPQAGASDLSRGHLVSEFLMGTTPAAQYAEQVLASGAAYAGFNLLAGNARQAVHCSNRSNGVSLLRKGVYGLSNHLLDTPWPKVVHGKARFSQLVSGHGPVDTDAVFEMLGDREQAPAEALPDTGVGLETERVLSSAFIAVEGYGTRSSTVLSISQSGRAELTERRFLQPHQGRMDPGQFESNRYQLKLPAGP